MTNGLDPLENLIGDHLDGVLDRQGEQELAERLAASADARRLLAAHMRLHGGLFQLGQAGALRDQRLGEDKPTAASRRRVVAMLAGIAAGLAVMAGYWLMHETTEPGPPVIARVEEAGEATRRSGGRAADLRKGAPVHSGERIFTADIAVIRFPDGTTVAMDERSDATFTLDGGAKHIHLHGGLLRLDVARQPAGQPLVVQTDKARVIALGTQFLVEASDECTVVEVEEGTVRLEAERGRRASVEAKTGEMARVDERGRITGGKLPAAADAKPAGDTIVYWNGSGKRVHVEVCRRLTKDPKELARMTRMTLAEAEKKGLLLCSRCPGSTTPGKGDRPKGSLQPGSSPRH